jgi:hypothetical protein
MARTTTLTPDVLCDTPDGYCEERVWVEATVSEDRARECAREVVMDCNGDPARPVGPVKRVFLRVANPKADWEFQNWVACKPTAKTAREFFEFDVTDIECPCDGCRAGVSSNG